MIRNEVEIYFQHRVVSEESFPTLAVEIQWGSNIEFVLRTFGFRVLLEYRESFTDDSGFSLKFIFAYLHICM